jgi:secreted PhoX family phosphatase
MTDSNESHERAAVGRREFLKLAAAAGVAAAIPAAATALAQSGAPAKRPAPADTTAHADSTHAAPAGPSPDAVALAGILQRRFPGRLSEEQWKSVTEDLDWRLGSGKRLRESVLANGAEPDVTFRA